MGAGDGAVRVQPTPVAGPRLGLLASAPRPNMPPDWLNGVKVQAEGCLGVADATTGYTWSGCNTTPADTKTDGPARNPFNVWLPYGIVEGDTCESEGWDGANFGPRARRLLIANESRKIERELWTGAAAHAGGFNRGAAGLGSTTGNLWLAAPSADDLGTVPAVFALGEAVQYAADTTTEQCMIHAQPRVVSAWSSANLLRREGNVIYEITCDHIVVPGTGYTGAGPDSDVDSPESGAAADQFGSSIYITSVVAVAEDAVQLLPETIGEALDRTTNSVTWRAERIVLAWWDGCAHGHIDVDLSNPCGSATS